MNHAKAIKRSHYSSITLITLFFLFIMAGFFGHFFYWEADLLEKDIVERGIEDKKNALKTSIDALVNGFESDFKYCSNRLENSAAGIGCDISFVIDMAKRRIASGPFMANEEIIVSTVRDHWVANGGRSAAGGTIFSVNKKGESIPFIQNEEIFEAVMRKGEILFERNNDAFMPGASGSEVITYGRYYQPFNWVIFASINKSRLVTELTDEYHLEKQKILLRTLKGMIPVLLFVILAFLCAYMYFLRISEIAVKYEEKQEKDDFASLTKNRDHDDHNDEETRQEELFNAIQAFIEGADDIFLAFAVWRGDSFYISQVSSGVERMLGYKTSDLIGKPMNYLGKPSEAEQNRVLSFIDIHGRHHSNGEGVLLKRGGGSVPVHYSAHLVHNDSGRLLGAFVAAFDISGFLETRELLDRTQERLLQSQKLEAIGILASGIAHDFNNVLSSIVGYSELLKEQLDQGSTERQDLEQILLATNRASSLVKQIHAFSRSKAHDNSYFEPGLIVKETLKMLRSTIPQSIAIKQDIRLQGETIYANTTRFHQLLMNLCTNAFQAMEHHGGHMKVRLRCIDDTSHVPHHYYLQGGKYLELLVADTGCGISEDLQKSFVQSVESFNGMNMAGASRLIDNFAMVKEMGGAMWFRDNDPKGTVFYVLFPVKQENGDFTSDGSMMEIPRGSETILFVDDEPEIIRVTKIMLESLGYTVYCASNGKEAVRVFNDKQMLVDLIITDQSMPEMTGAELVIQIRKLSSVPVILCTGYSARISEENWKNTGVNGFIMKPFRKKDIAILIRDTLENGGMAERLKHLSLSVS